MRSNVIRHDAHRFYLAHGYSVLKDQRLFVKELRPQGADRVLADNPWIVIINRSRGCPIPGKFKA